MLNSHEIGSANAKVWNLGLMGEKSKRYLCDMLPSPYELKLRRSEHKSINMALKQLKTSSVVSNPWFFLVLVCGANGSDEGPINQRCFQILICC